MSDNKKKVATKRAPPKKKTASGYVKSAPIALGTVLVDIRKAKWIVGPSIGSGGFGDIYSCCSESSKSKSKDNYEYVVKIEPQENGPLFVEMHFYLRNGKLEDIEKFKKSRNLTSFGMPHHISSGSVDLKGDKHRFIVMPRYGKDVWNLFLANNRRIPESTVLRLAIQMLDVYEYIHNRTYVHADLKGANILLGFGKGGEQQAYLVDFGLASHYTTKDFKPDPKKMHNGTIEYTSRDAHNGVPTMRGDLEILGYNLLHWLGGKLPWESCLEKPKQVQELKETFMKNVETSAKKSFANLPSSVLQLLKFVANMKYNDIPDYAKLRKYFEVDLKALGYSNSGNLVFSSTAANSAKSATNKDIAKIVNSPANRKRVSRKSESDDADDTDDEVLSEKSPAKKKKVNTPVVTRRSPIKSADTKPSGACKGEIIVNNNLKNPTEKPKKVYEFNFELDVSLDANVIVNINRKAKKNTPKQATKDEDGDEVIPESPDAGIQKGRRPKVSVRSTTRIESGRKTPRGK